MDREEIKLDLGKNRLPKISRRYGIRVIFYVVILVLLGLWYLKKTGSSHESLPSDSQEIHVIVEPSDSL